jgi:BirA family biotin operon repressor/biotin-[acetyl-CoA-carboxylase] ligase
MLAVSVLLRPARSGLLGADAKGWIPLLAGLAMTRALAQLGARTELKWPNDVLIAGRKVCGILAEAQPGDVVIVGSGVNLTLTEEQLPVPNATSMLIANAETDADTVLAGYLAELLALYSRFAESGGDSERSRLRESVSKACSTLGRRVRIELPAGEELVGVADQLDPTGRLVVVGSDGRRTSVSSGDVTHLRY